GPQLLDSVEMLGPGMHKRPAIFVQRTRSSSIGGDLAGCDHLQQRVSHLRVELPTRLDTDFAEDPLARPSAPVGAVTGHRLESITGMDDERLERDLLAA